MPYGRGENAAHINGVLLKSAALRGKPFGFPLLSQKFAAVSSARISRVLFLVVVVLAAAAAAFLVVGVQRRRLVRIVVLFHHAAELVEHFVQELVVLDGDKLFLALFADDLQNGDFLFLALLLFVGGLEKGKPPLLVLDGADVVALVRFSLIIKQY